MIVVLLTAAAVVWLLVAIALGVVIGMGIAEADRREKSRFPHEVAEAPETVQGESRAVVVPLPTARSPRLDVKL